MSLASNEYASHAEANQKQTSQSQNAKYKKIVIL